MSDKIENASNNGRQEFNKAANPQPEKQGVDSQQIKNSESYPQPKPPRSTRSTQDRITHQENMQKDNRAVELYNAAKARKEQQNQVSLNKDREK